MSFMRGWFWFSLGVTLILFGCSSTPKNKLSLSALHGKKIALVAIEGEDTARKVTEVALINQLVKKGTFELLSKGSVESARSHLDQDPTDWKALAKRAGAEVALRVSVDEFHADERSGYNKEEVYDSQLADENGTDGKTERVYKAKSIDGSVRFDLKFTDLASGNTTSGIAEAKDRVEANARVEAVHLPPKLRFLENLSNTAFERFFEKFE
ncbi:MAG: hypothetical protein HYX41_03315 [Bdellovibrio sp.]|nr:hypothetical protein [Bdellovibrio sp.]